MFARLTLEFHPLSHERAAHIDSHLQALQEKGCLPDRKTMAFIRGYGGIAGCAELAATRGMRVAGDATGAR